jgi:hypothetical protein
MAKCKFNFCESTEFHEINKFGARYIVCSNNHAQKKVLPFAVI